MVLQMRLSFNLGQCNQDSAFGKVLSYLNYFGGYDGWSLSFKINIIAIFLLLSKPSYTLLPALFQIHGLFFSLTVTACICIYEYAYIYF